jgi:hypothetical protein
MFANLSLANLIDGQGVGDFDQEMEHCSNSLKLYTLKTHTQI